MIYMKKRKEKKLTKQQQIVEDMREINKSMIIEIFVLIYFILSILLSITLFITIPLTLILFSYEEFKIKKAKERIGFSRGGNLYRIMGIVIILTGFVLLISSPLFFKVMVQMAIPATIIVVGTFIFLISKFYDAPKSNEQT